MSGRSLIPLAAASLLLVTAACGDRPPEDDDARRAPDADSLAAAAALDSAVDRDVPGDGSEERPFARPVAIFVEATPDQIETARADVPDEDFYAMREDLMFYRASGRANLREAGVEVVTVAGRRPLHFMVDGEPRQYDFTGSTTLDLIVVYEPGREPRTFAPIEGEQAAAYFSTESERP